MTKGGQSKIKCAVIATLYSLYFVKLENFVFLDRCIVGTCFFGGFFFLCEIDKKYVVLIYIKLDCFSYSAVHCYPLNR